VADAILAALREADDGLTRNDIREMFGRHKSSERIGRALAMLQEQGKIAMRKEQTDGRPREVWLAVT
jgi:predicted transcriptional regulator